MSEQADFIEEFVNTMQLQMEEGQEAQGKEGEDFLDLLDFILAKARRLTLAEAGTVFVCEPMLHSPSNVLRCQTAQNDEVKIEQETFSMPIDSYSIAGYTALNSQVLKIDNLYHIEHTAPYEFNPGFDKRYGYRSVSMLSVPLKNVKNKVIGVIQLLNHLADANSDDKYAPFREEDKKNMAGLSLILGMMVERAALMEELERLQGNNVYGMRPLD